MKYALLAIGFIIGTAFTMAILSNIGVIPDYKAAKAACEADLPRSKECTMMFMEEVE